MDRSKLPHKGPAPDDDSQGRECPHSGVTPENVSPSPSCPEHQCRGQNIQEHLHQVNLMKLLKLKLVVNTLSLYHLVLFSEWQLLTYFKAQRGGESER